MQDRFRFRAWDKKLKCYRSNVQNGSFVYGDCSIVPSCVIFDDDRFVVEQCAGLKDKNNKLIYEGDILDTPLGNGKVIYDDLGKFVTQYSLYLGFNYLINGTVIGNIHENPELIKRVSEE